MFTDHLKDPEETQEAFEFGQGYSSAGHMASREEDGYYILMEREKTGSASAN